MIRTTHATLKMLRAGRAETITFPLRRGALGQLLPCPVKEGHEYTLLAPETDDFKRETVRVLAVTVLKGDSDWAATLRKGHAADLPTLLKARPGLPADKRKPREDGREREPNPNEVPGDYTHELSKGAHDEPEPVDAQALRRIQRDSRTAERVRLDAETRDSRDQLRRAIDDLASRPDIGEPAARRLANMRRELQRLERELAA